MNSKTKKKQEFLIDLKLKLIVLTVVVSFCFILSYGIYYAESVSQVSTIQTFSDSNWYMFGAMTTTGWGDLVVTTDMGKTLTIIGYIITRVSLLVFAYSAAIGLAGSKNKVIMTVDDRLLVVENELKQLRSSINGMEKDINFAVKTAHKEKNKRVEYVVKSLESLKEFVSSPVSKGVSVIAEFSEGALSESCANYSSVLAECEQNGVSSITFSDKKIKF